MEQLKKIKRKAKFFILGALILMGGNTFVAIMNESWTRVFNIAAITLCAWVIFIWIRVLRKVRGEHNTNSNR